MKFGYREMWITILRYSDIGLGHEPVLIGSRNNLYIK